MRITAPPRQTPVSMKSPGMSSRITVWTQSRMLSSRLEPIIEWASVGQVAPASRFERSARGSFVTW